VIGSVVKACNLKAQILKDGFNPNWVETQFYHAMMRISLSTDANVAHDLVADIMGDPSGL
jgi:hypothetical protein